MGEFWKDLREIQAGKDAHQNSYGRITGEQSFLERMIQATTLDTPLGQIGQSLIYRFENDGYKPKAVEGFNAIDDGDLTGFENDFDAIITATSQKEIDMRLLMKKRNTEIRNNLKNHGFARFMGNVIDPINLIPIPLARGMGWVKGAVRGSGGVAFPFLGSEILRASIDPTATGKEVVFAISGGALFGGAIGGLVGGIRPRNLDLAGKRWFEIDQEGIDAYNRIQDVDDKILDGLAPLVERTEGQSAADHLKTFVHKVGDERVDDYNARIDLLAENKSIYNDVVTAARRWQPDQFLSSGIGLEKWRFSQHPFFMMKNTTFLGDLGNRIRRLPDRISGSPGMLNKGNLKDVPTAQGVYNRAKLLDIHAVKASGDMYNAYARFSGALGEEAPGMKSGAQVIHSIKETVLLRNKHYAEFLDDVSRIYMSGGKSSNLHIMSGVESMKTYYKEMGELAVESGVFGLRRIEKDLRYLEEVHLPRSRDFLEKRFFGDPENPKYKSRLQKLREKYELEASVKSSGEGRGFSEPQLKLLEDLEFQIKELEIEVKQIDDFISNEDAFIAGVKEGDTFSNQTVAELVANIQKRNYLRERVEFYKNKENLPKADEMGHGHFPRMWNRQAVTENRDQLIKILEDWFEKNSTTGKRAQATVDNILKEHDPGLVKRVLREGLKDARVNDPSIIRAMERKVDDIYKSRKAADRGAQRAEASKLMNAYMNSYGFGDHIKVQIADALKEIDRMASMGEMEGFGAATSTFERTLDIPNAFLIRGEGRTGGIATVDFIETNPEIVMRGYHRRMSTSIEMANEFGDPTMSNYLKELEDEIAALADAAKTNKEREGILKEGALQLQAAKDLKEKVLGVFKIPDDPGSISARTVRATKNFMVMALMGKPMIAALADMGRGVMSVGAKQAFGGLFAKLGAGVDDFVKAGKMHDEFIGANEMALHGRFERMADLEGYVTGQNKFEKILEAGVDKMFILNGLMPYTDVMKRFFGSIIQSNMSKASIEWAGNARFERQFFDTSIKGLSKRFGDQFIFGPIDASIKSPRVAPDGAIDIPMAFFRSETGKIHIDADRILASFDDAPWRVPKMEGVNALDDFASPEEWLDFVIRHETSHTVNKIHPNESPAAYENRTNQIALDQVSNVETIIVGRAGKISENDKIALLKNGIGFEDAIRIAEEFRKHGEIGTSLHLSNVGAWDDLILSQKFRTALIQEINNAVITPGPAEKLNFMSTHIGGLMTQFKAFGFSATHRTLLAGLQQKDAKAFHGIMAMIAMGYIVDRIKSPSYDQRDLSSLDRFVQAVDYSGTTGIMFDVNNMMEVMTGNNFGIRPMLGVDSFFKDPNLAQRTGQVGGPAASLGFDLLRTLFDPDSTGSDFSRSVRRLIPFNNLIWWSGIVDQVQRSAGADLDATNED